MERLPIRLGDDVGLAQRLREVLNPRRPARHAGLPLRLEVKRALRLERGQDARQRRGIVEAYPARCR
jgi:hypothetical protein